MTVGTVELMIAFSVLLQ